MRSHESNNLKQSIIHTKNLLINQDIEQTENKKSTEMIFYNKEATKNNKEEKILRNAYKNVINVISNLLNNIEDEKINGKLNFQTKNVNKKPIKKIISYNIPRFTKYSLNNQTSKEIESFEKNSKILRNRYTNKLNNNWNSQKQLLINNNNDNDNERNGQTSPSIKKNKIKLPITKNHKSFNKNNKSFNFIFKCKNKLTSKYNSTKILNPDYSSDKKSKNNYLIKNKKISNNYDNKYNSTSSCYSKTSLDLKNKSKSDFTSSYLEDNLTFQEFKLYISLFKNFIFYL
jgi:hypothetical protein